MSQRCHFNTKAEADAHKYTAIIVGAPFGIAVSLFGLAYWLFNFLFSYEIMESLAPLSPENWTITMVIIHSLLLVVCSGYLVHALPRHSQAITRIKAERRRRDDG